MNTYTGSTSKNKYLLAAAGSGNDPETAPLALQHAVEAPRNI